MARAGRFRDLIICLLLLAATTVTGLMLHVRTPHGSAAQWAGSLSAGPPEHLEVVHVVFVAGLTASMLWHLFGRRRQLRALVATKRRTTLGKSRSLLANGGLVALLVASFITGFAPAGPGQVEHHTAVSLVLVLALGAHAARRLGRRTHLLRRSSVVSGS